MASVKDRLSAAGVLQHVALPATIDAILSTLQIQPPQGALPPGVDGHVLFGVVEQALGIFDLNIIPPGQGNPRPYVLEWIGPGPAPDGFRFAVSLKEGPQAALFKALPDAVGRALTAAEVVAAGDEESLRALPGRVTTLVGTNVWLAVEGKPGTEARMVLTGSPRPPYDVLTLGVDPPAALLGSSGFGLSLPEGLTIDLSEEAIAAGRTLGVDGQPVATPADEKPWQGIVVRRARFFLPQGVPFIGGHATDASLQVGVAPRAGIDLALTTFVPAAGKRPRIDVYIECRDPTASGLSSFLPTLVEASMELPIEEPQAVPSVGVLTFASGKPVRARMRYARRAGTDESELSLALETQGEKGLAAVSAGPGDTVARAVVTSATFATALIADRPAEGDSGITLWKLLGLGGLASSFVQGGNLVVHSAKLVSSGHALPAGEKVAFVLDYSVSTQITPIEAGVLSLQLQKERPLRLRLREVVLTLDPKAADGDIVTLDYSRSAMEIEDPGLWNVDGPASLFDILGTRSGRGSLWIEIDLAFKLDLGPVKVSGATIRATLDTNTNTLSASLQGLAASISLPPLIAGSGSVQLTDTGFAAALDVDVIPVGVRAAGTVRKQGSMVQVGLAADFPGPVPIANTGLALYGMGGVFAANGEPDLQQPVSPETQLAWGTKVLQAFAPGASDPFRNADHTCTVGVAAVIGTAPDFGFTFSANAGVFVTTPSVAIRGAIDAGFLGPRKLLTDPGQGAWAATGKGVIAIDHGVSIALTLEYKIPEIVTITVPVAASFPTSPSPSDWYLHFGADGWTPPAGGKDEGRGMGPVRATLLPNLIGQEVDAYVMFRGSGITAWPRGGPHTIAQSPLAAFGFGFDLVFGVKPIVWAEVFARADILLTTAPLSFVGLGQLGGKLCIGFFSVGVEAKIHIVLVDQRPPYLDAELCGTVDLFFDEIRECIHISYHKPEQQDVPPPVSPLENAAGQWLVDDEYRKLVRLAERKEDVGDSVWPDAIPLLVFSTAPDVTVDNAQFGPIGVAGGVSPAAIGNDLLTYEWKLTDLRLVDDATGQDVAGPLSHAWLTALFGDPTQQPQPPALALLTPTGDMTLYALPDAGASLPHRPLDRRANSCQFRADPPRAGWALGEDAVPDGDGYRLPPHEVSASPFQSRVSARATTRIRSPAANFTLSRATAYLLGPLYGYLDAQLFPVQDVGTDVAIDACLFPGALCLAAVPRPEDANPVDDARTKAWVDLEFDDALDDATVWWFIWKDVWMNFPAVGTLTWWQRWVRFVERPDGAGGAGPWTVASCKEQRDGWLVATRAAAPARGISAVATAGTRIAIVAVHGVTATAKAAEAAANAAAAAEAAKQASASQKPPTTNAPSATSRCVLQPDTLYRIDVELAWSGTLYQRDDSGKKVEVARGPADPNERVVKSYWFRTAKLRTAPTRITLATPDRFVQIFGTRDVFDPAMIERYLIGYEPFQSEVNRFANDPVHVNFKHSHVAALAATYGFELACKLRRLDANEAEFEPGQQLIRFVKEDSLFAGPSKVIATAYLSSPCGFAPPGVELEAPVELRTEAWYEVFVVAKNAISGATEGRLRGVSFRTSRWVDAAAMLRDLSFLPLPFAGVATGDVALATSPAHAVQVSDDAGFDELLENAFGLEGWPVAADPRVSHLWKEIDEAWHYVGTFVESPEPIDRGPRLAVKGLAMETGAANFDVVARDRSGCRLLFATSTPFAPGAGTVLCIAVTDVVPGQAARVLEGRLQVPVTPGFAKESA